MTDSAPRTPSPPDDEAHAVSIARERREQRGLGTVTNALRLLEELAAMPEAGISELAARLQLSKPAVDRLLVTLAASGFAVQLPQNHKYKLTPKLVALADQVQSRLDILSIARPHLEDLARLTHETINLGVYTHGAVTYVDKIPSSDVFRIEVAPGTKLPAFATALGKAILAHTATGVVADYVRTTAAREKDFDAEAFRAELVTTRETGYSHDLGEILADVCCVAAPVFGRADHAIAAVSITSPRSRFDGREEELAVHVMATAKLISANAQAAAL